MAKPMNITDAAKPFRDAFEYNPGHSDLDDEQPISIFVTLGDWRKLNMALLSEQPDARARWIPVIERLPDGDITVMVACKDTDEPVWLGYHDESGWYSATDSVPLTKLVTHWRGMPEAPRG